jgi:cyclophilin family peptidyl-prolyl cis-trans isomerase
MLKSLVLLMLSTALSFSLACAQEGRKETASSDTTETKTTAAPDTVKDKAAVPDTTKANVTKTTPETSQNPVVVIETNYGNFEVGLFMKESPITAKNFLSLVNKGFYNGLTFHRIVPDFVIQGGDPSGDGSGGPGYSIQDEKSIQRQVRGTLGMAKSGPNTAGSQFYVNLKDNLRLDDAGFTAFAKVVKGMDVVDKIGRLKNSGQPDNKALEKVIMKKVYVKK